MSAAFSPFVYGLVDPQDAGHVRYVGMARVTASRPYDHAKNARKGSTVNPHLMNWVRKLQTEGREYKHIVLEALSPDAPRELLGFVEKCYIKSLREVGHKLTNATIGGEGGDTGITPEGRESLRAKARGNQAFLGRRHTEETKAAQSAAQKGIKKSESQVAGIVSGWKHRKRVAGWAPAAGLVHSDKTKAQMSASGKFAWNNPERRAALAQRNRDRAAAKRGAL